MRILFCVATLILSLHIKAQQFQDVTNDIGVFFVPAHQSLMGGGVVWLDYNNDNAEDLFFTGCRTRDILYKNNGDGTFTDVTTSAGLALTDFFNSMGAVQGDINNDGFPDLFITTWKDANGQDLIRNVLYLNNGNGTFTDISVQAGITEESWSTSAVMLDINLDGYLDIYVLNYISETGFILDDYGNTIGFSHDCFDNFLYINNGDNTFTESAEIFGLQSGGCGLALSASDIDKDGDPDIQIANDFGEFITPNQLFINNYPEIGFTDESAASGFDLGMYGMGVAVGDIDNDLDQDFYVTNMGKNGLLTNEENGTSFTNITNDSGTANTGNDELLYTSWGDVFMDVDNDGFLDLFVANGHMSSAPFIQNVQDDPDKLFMNNGDNTFSDSSEESGVDYRGICRGSAYGDFNSDGYLDIAVSGIQNPFFGNFEGVKIYENQNSSGNFLAMSLEGTLSNRSAFGTKVTLYSGTDSFYRELLGGSSHLSQNQSLIHFGLGELQSIDSLRIDWPSGLVEIKYDCEINSFSHVVEDLGTSIIESDLKNRFSLNPTLIQSGQSIFLKIPEKNGTLEIYSLSGKLVLRLNLSEYENQVSLTLSCGTYIAKLNTEKQQWVEKIHITN